MPTMLVPLFDSMLARRWVVILLLSEFQDLLAELGCDAGPRRDGAGDRQRLCSVAACHFAKPNSILVAPRIATPAIA
ncbi:hypothetical protein PY650_00600 [Rhizobium calliandrae]|uniref:Uncharacterized protein n=1 Tax=Rhizobium calliandrae TaxID=1312182 RepID=A0ABT7K867_9HYPH|nr:hypothetical protein [Rhizobium calliandrae]MDL2404178.1 hypothetical protein [Rhizobium calliandrae]